MSAEPCEGALDDPAYAHHHEALGRSRKRVSIPCRDSSSSLIRPADDLHLPLSLCRDTSCALSGVGAVGDEPGDGLLRVVRQRVNREQRTVAVLDVRRMNRGTDDETVGSDQDVAFAAN